RSSARAARRFGGRWSLIISPDNLHSDREEERAPRDRDGNQGLSSRAVRPRGLSDIVCSGYMRRQTLLPSALGHLGAMGSRLRQAGTAVVHPLETSRLGLDKVRKGASSAFVDRRRIGRSAPKAVALAVQTSK